MWCSVHGALAAFNSRLHVGHEPRLPTANEIEDLASQEVSLLSGGRNR